MRSPIFRQFQINESNLKGYHWYRLSKISASTDSFLKSFPLCHENETSLGKHGNVPCNYWALDLWFSELSEFQDCTDWLHCTAPVFSDNQQTVVNDVHVMFVLILHETSSDMWIQIRGNTQWKRPIDRYLKSRSSYLIALRDLTSQIHFRPF